MRVLSFIILFLLNYSVAAAANLTVGIHSKISSSEAAKKTDNVALSVLNHVMEGLLALDDKLRVVPMLAESYTVSDDGRRYMFHIRNDITFHNGEPLTATEVKWSLDHHRDSDRNWGDHCREYLDGSARLYMRPANITEVKITGPHSVEVTLQSRNALFPKLLATPSCINAILHPSSVDATGNWGKPVATGPYMFDAHTGDGGVILKRFEGYKSSEITQSGLAGSKDASFDQITYKSFDTPEAMVEAFNKGEVDVALDTPYELYGDVGTQLKKQFILESTASWHQLFINTRKNALLGDVRIRRAIFHSIDQRAMANALFGDDALANASAATKGSQYYTAVQEKGLEANPALSKKLLVDAGYDGESIEIQASSKPYSLSLKAAQIAAEMMRGVGINAVISEVDWETHKKTTYYSQGQLSSMPVSGLADPVQMFGSITGQKQDLTWFMWEDVEADALISGTAMIEDNEVKQKRLNQLHEKYISWVPTVGLFNFPMINLKSSCLDGYESWAMGLPRFWGVKKRTDCRPQQF